MQMAASAAALHQCVPLLPRAQNRRIQWRCGSFSDSLLFKQSRRRAMVTRASNASTVMYAKEMERVSAKEALLLAVQDAGGFASVFGGGNDARVIEIFDKVLALERLNPTPRPTTSPLLEGLWKFEWAGVRSPDLLAANFLIKNLPSSLLSSSGMTLDVLDGTAKVTLNLKFFGTVESNFILTTGLRAEGPSKLKEQYIDAVLAPPVVPEGSQLQGIYDQILASVQRLPDFVKDSMSSGLMLPLGGSFERLMLISYLDEEMMIARGATGGPDVLSRLAKPAPIDPVITEYQS